MGYFPLPHPSPRTQIWLARNGWFGEEVVPAVREAVDSLRIGRNL
jgi:uracil-DNA glycosylase